MEYLTPYEPGGGSAFAFLLSGWKPGVVPGEVVNVDNTSLNWFPAEVEVTLNSFAFSRSYLTIEMHLATRTWELAARKNGNGYNFKGSIYENTYQDSSLFIQYLPLCSKANDSSAPPTSFYSYPFVDSEASFSDRAQYEALRNQVNGSFDAMEATLTASGAFIGSFDSVDIYPTRPTFYGRYTITFTGVIDDYYSHTLDTTSENNPDWQDNDASRAKSSEASLTMLPTVTCTPTGGAG